MRCMLWGVSAIGVLAGGCMAPTDLAPSQGAVSVELVQRVRELAALSDAAPMPPAPRVRPELAELGRLLAFDKVLSGNQNISCMTCHHPVLGTGDGRSLPVGQGGEGLGPSRVHPTGVAIPRSAPPLFNLHALPTMFWDSRIDARGSLTTPAGPALTPELVAELTFGAPAAQAMFPVTSADEMRGLPGDNLIADLAGDDFGGIWDALMERVLAIDAYRIRFAQAYPDLGGAGGRGRGTMRLREDDDDDDDEDVDEDGRMGWPSGAVPDSGRGTGGQGMGAPGAGGPGDPGACPDMGRSLDDMDDESDEDDGDEDFDEDDGGRACPADDDDWDEDFDEDDEGHAAPGGPPGAVPFTFAHAANAIAAFEIQAFEASNTPWDRFLAGDDTALSAEQLRGAELFFGEGGCASCHRGALLSDLEHHNTVLAQLGPGKGDGEDGRDDFGRFRESGDPADLYAFRTPPLRNVALTGPWGHAGQFSTLEAFVRHYNDPIAQRRQYRPQGLDVGLAEQLIDNAEAVIDTASPMVVDIRLSDQDVRALVAFLEALTDPASLDLRRVIPREVPSGIPLGDDAG